ncbi:MAG TPA: hypothetical protein VEQ38_21065 [Verrucomicrobiae bacterium]|jgi:hypothetical protein|nr:hypothetical protein [Verrucomicrobiae bacterium]
MNLLVEDPLSKTGFSGPIALFPTSSAVENSTEQPTSRLARDQMNAFSDAKSDNAYSGHFSVAPAQPPGPTPEKDLALGVLKQAARDLRRFHSATKGVKQELYLDAYSWVTANDFLWSYSFVNVCKLLNVCPEVVRAEIFADASLSWLNYWTKRAGNVSRRVRASFAHVFAGRNHPEGTEVKPVGFMYLNEYEKTVHPIC